jgi:hypothetical protein
MKSAIYLTGHVLASDIVTALEPMIDDVELFERLDTALTGRSGERVAFDDTEVLVEMALDALDDADKLPEPESLLHQANETDITNLAEAIRCGDTEQAELLLDRVFSTLGEELTIREWIDRGRYSKKARLARKVPAPKLRDAA